MSAKSTPSVGVSSPFATGEVILARAAASGTKAYLSLLHAGGAEEILSYPQVIERAQRWRALYAARGAQPGDRVVIVLRHSLDLYASFVGALLGGFVPSMFAFPTPKFSERAYFASIGQLLESAQPRLLVAFDELIPKLKPFLGQAPSLAAILEPKDVAAHAPSTEPAVVRGADEVAFLQYSSGTTGLRKGVAISHRALEWQVREYARAIRLQADDRIVTWLPLYHDMGLVACFLTPFLTGTPVVAMSAFDWVKRPGILLSALSQHAGTLCWLPNFAYNFIARSVKDDELRGVDLSRVRGFVNCSEPIMAQSHDVLHQRLASAGLRREALAVSYAMAETTFAVTSGGFGQSPMVDWVDGRRLAGEFRAEPCAADAPAARALVSSGRPLRETEVRILDEQGAELPERRVGEIVVTSPSLLKEYFRNESETARGLRDGRLFTGDLGYLADGELFVTGRKKDMIIVGGQNVFPQDVEDIVNRVADVIPGRCVALGVTDEARGTETLVVIAETHLTDTAGRDAICAAIVEGVATQSDVVVSDVQLVPHMWLHKSSSGKIARGENLRRYLELRAQPAPVIGAAPPVRGAHDATEVMRVVRGVLDQRPTTRGRAFAPTDALVSSGAIDSFGLVNLLAELERAFGVRIPDAWADLEHLDTAERIAATLAKLDGSVTAEADVPKQAGDIPLRAERIIPAERVGGFWTWRNRMRLRSLGVKFGSNLQSRGSIILRLGATPSNLVLGDDVALMPGVDLKLRDRGRIIIGSGVQLDTGVRIVAANDATVLIGDNVRIGKDTIINAGSDLTIGRGTLIGAGCSLNSSEHRLEGRGPVASLGYVHAPILVGEDVWLGATVFVELGSRIGRGAVIGVRSVVVDDITAFGIAMGSPARVVKMRSESAS